MAAIAVGAFPIKRKQRVYRNFELHYNVDNDECIKRYRFTLHSINVLENLIGEDLRRQTDRSHSVTSREQICLALRYFASGSFMQVTSYCIRLCKYNIILLKMLIWI